MIGVTALQTRPRLLSASDMPGLRRLTATDPVAHCVVDSRIDLAPDLDPRRLGGFVWGIDDPDADVPTLRAAIFHGGNLIPVGSDLAALRVIADQLGRSHRGCSSIVGPAAAVATIWPLLERGWGRPRSTRGEQPLLATSARATMPVDPNVRLVSSPELASFVPASVAMFSEELGISPLGRDGGTAYRSRLADVIAARRAFARFDDRGRVVFKAEIGALSRSSAQIQGVWVRPELRGAGIGTAAMAAVMNLALYRAPTVSLYVNDFNVVARRMYDALGFEQVGTFRTILF